MAELESRQKGFSVGYILSTNPNSRAEMKSRLEAVTAALGSAWDFEPDGATDAEIKANYGLMASADAAYHALLRDEGGMTFDVAGIAPGHGGKDPGAIGGKKNMEKTVVLNVSLLVGKLIKKEYPDVKVVYTRDNDRFIGLAKRAKIANEIGADLFISIHATSFNNSLKTSIFDEQIGKPDLAASTNGKPNDSVNDGKINASYFE